MQIKARDEMKNIIIYSLKRELFACCFFALIISIFHICFFRVNGDATHVEDDEERQQQQQMMMATDDGNRWRM